MYGTKPSSVIDVIPLPLPAKAHPKALGMVEHMQQVHKEVKKRIEAASARHKAKADIHRRRRVTFHEGDLVWVILTKKRQPSSLYMKLHDRKVGPCQVLKQINENAYNVELPSPLQISNSFHVQHLLSYHQYEDSS